MNDLAQDYLRTFSTDPGRRVLEDLERRAFLHASTLAPGAVVDIHRAMVNEGARTLVLIIKDQIRRAKTPAPAEKVFAASATAERTVHG